MRVFGPMSKTGDKIERKGNTGSYCPYAAPPIVCCEMRSDSRIAVLSCTAEPSICQLFLELISEEPGTAEDCFGWPPRLPYLACIHTRG